MRIAPEGGEEILEYTLDERSPQRIGTSDSGLFWQRGRIGKNSRDEVKQFFKIWTPKQ